MWEPYSCFSTRSVESCEESLRYLSTLFLPCPVSVLALSSRVRNHPDFPHELRVVSCVSVLALSSRVRNRMAYPWRGFRMQVSVLALSSRVRNHGSARGIQHRIHRFSTRSVESCEESKFASGADTDPYSFSTRSVESCEESVVAAVVSAVAPVFQYSLCRVV